MNQDIVTKRPPWLYSIELTNECPMRCIMCARTDSMTRPIGFIDTSMFETIIDQLFEASTEHQRKQRKLRLHQFGESLTHKSFDRLIAYAADKGFLVELSINPLMLKDDITERLLDSGVHSLLMSLDGHDNESFEAIRGVPNAFDISVERLLKFLDRKSAREKKVNVTLSMIDFPENAKSLEKMKPLWEAHEGIESFRQKLFLKWDGKSPQVNDLATTETELAASEEITRRGGCSDPWKHMSVLWDGRVVPCCFDYDGKYVYGDLNHQSLIEIWNAPPIQGLRTQFKNSMANNALCESCEFAPNKISSVNTY